AEAPGNGQPAVAAATRTRVPTADFASMANPLAQSARKATKADIWAAAGASSAADDKTISYSRPGRAERPRWSTQDQPAATANGRQGADAPPVMARWQPPAQAQTAAPAAANGHGTTGIQPARRAARPEAQPQSERPKAEPGTETTGPGNDGGRRLFGRRMEPARPASDNGLDSAAPAVEAAPAATEPKIEQQYTSGGSEPKPVQGAWAAGIQDEEDTWDEQEDEDTGDERVPRILVLDRVGDFSTDIARATVDLDPAPEILRLSRSTQVIEVVEQEEPDVIVVAPEEVTGAGLKRLAEIHRKDPKVVVVISESTKTVTAAQTAACGTSDIIPLGITKARLRTKMTRALETAEELRNEQLVVAERIVVQEAPAPVERPDFTPPAYAPAPAPASVARSHTKLARVFTVASASGGCGKTFYSTNFAAYLAKATGGKVLLVDLDLQFGEVAISLHLRPKRTISELVQEEDIAAALSDYVVDHSAGYKVLCAPRDPVAGDKVGPRETTAVLEAARSQFDYIVVDTPPSINETCLAAFDQSQSLVIMATMDLPSLKNLRVFLETLKKLNLPADQVSLVVNKAESGTGIDLKEVEPLYPQGFSAVLPYAKQVSWSINMGMPVLVADPNADISRKLVEGAVKLVPPATGKQLPWTAPAAAPRRGWFSRLLKGKAK
ncbi:MAG TPA: AAA family ATPase, partial [Actinomycetota bacterium]|nr:AAA family ATPase [Actinomycetota bacterium]